MDNNAMEKLGMDNSSAGGIPMREGDAKKPGVEKRESFEGKGTCKMPNVVDEKEKDLNEKNKGDEIREGDAEMCESDFEIEDELYEDYDDLDEAYEEYEDEDDEFDKMIEDDDNGDYEINGVKL